MPRSHRHLFVLLIHSVSLSLPHKLPERVSLRAARWGRATSPLARSFLCRTCFSLTSKTALVMETLWPSHLGCLLGLPSHFSGPASGHTVLSCGGGWGCCVGKLHPLFVLLFKKFFATFKYLILPDKLRNHLDKFLPETAPGFLVQWHYIYVLTYRETNIVTFSCWPLLTLSDLLCPE